ERQRRERAYNEARAPQGVGEAPAEQQEAAEGEGVGVDDPREVVLVEVERAPDRGQRDGDDRGGEDDDALREGETCVGRYECASAVTNGGRGRRAGASPFLLPGEAAVMCGLLLTGNRVPVPFRLAQDTDPRLRLQGRLPVLPRHLSDPWRPSPNPTNARSAPMRAATASGSS